MSKWSEVPPDELPPWLSLPAEVRKRVNERMARRYGREDDQRTEEFRQDLRNLSAFRLIEHYGLKKAMRKGRDYPGFGPDPAAWQAAYRRCLATLERERSDPLSVERTKWLFSVVKEELDNYDRTQDS